jgi:tRNA-2-methylthio-N6-dimethylallyladenosine synthase
MKINKTYYIITIGCQMNVVDSERLAAFLEENGFSLAKDINQADAIIINTCGVKQSAEDRAYGLIHTIRKTNKSAKIVITGCLSKRTDVKKRLFDRVNIFLPINEMIQLPALLLGKDGEELKPRFSLDEIRLKEGEKYLNILPKHGKEFMAYVPIGNGCNNFCAYCVVPYARGREVYRPASEIIKEVKDLIKKGYKEITLIAQNVNSYHDKDYDFPKLLEAVVKISGDFWVRFSSSHPKDMSDELIKVLGSSDKICSHLHLAVQSGDDAILKVMNRKYTAAHFIKLIEKVRASKPGIAITTDVIVGFPGETRKQFANTIKLFKKVKFDLAYISQYSPRYGTVSAQMKDNVSYSEKKRREEEINTILKKTALDNNKKYIGNEVVVLVEGMNRKGKYYGKTSTYQTVLIRSSKKATKKLLGTFVHVKISEILPFALEGDLIIKK